MAFNSAFKGLKEFGPIARWHYCCQ